MYLECNLPLHKPHRRSLLHLPRACSSYVSISSSVCHARAEGQLRAGCWASSLRPSVPSPWFFLCQCTQDTRRAGREPCRRWTKQIKEYTGVFYVTPPKAMPIKRACVSNCDTGSRGAPRLILILLSILPVGGLEGTPIMSDNHMQAAVKLQP